MDYEFWFNMLISFLAGFIIAKLTPIYIGTDKEKYSQAGLGILLREK